MRASLYLGIGLITLSGCAAKRQAHVNLLIGPECHATAELLNCTNLHLNPPTCKQAKVTYPKGCERVEMK